MIRSLWSDLCLCHAHRLRGPVVRGPSPEREIRGSIPVRAGDPGIDSPSEREIRGSIPLPEREIRGSIPFRAGDPGIDSPFPGSSHACDVDIGSQETTLIGTASSAQWLRSPPREQQNPGFDFRLRRDFSGSSRTSDLKVGTPVAALSGA